MSQSKKVESESVNTIGPDYLDIYNPLVISGAHALFFLATIDVIDPTFPESKYPLEEQFANTAIVDCQ